MNVRRQLRAEIGLGPSLSRFAKAGQIEVRGLSDIDGRDANRGDTMTCRQLMSRRSLDSGFGRKQGVCLPEDRPGRTGCYRSTGE